MFLINFKFQWPWGGGVPDPLTPLRVDPCVYMYFVYSEFYLKALERVKLNYSFTEKITRGWLGSTWTKRLVKINRNNVKGCEY